VPIEDEVRVISRRSGALELRVNSYLTFVEHKTEEAGRIADRPLRKVATVAVIQNPYANRYVEDLQPLITASVEIGHQLAELALAAMAPFSAESYGKGGIVGLAGEQEHANALLTTAFAEPLRKALGGGKAWIPSFTKRGGPGTTIDVPLACKDAIYVRSHYDGITIALPNGPQPDEVAVIFCVANRGRLNARVGGLRFEDRKGDDGLV
jgi:hypothetical protein